MKPALLVVLVLFFAGICQAISVEDVVRLSKLKTGDDLILQMIQKEGLDKKITSQDVVRLKQNGVSERVIDYMWQISHEKSAIVGDNIRSYRMNTADGRQVTMFTNLDEGGKRMGGEAPPAPQYPQAEAAPAPTYDEPREIRVVVETPQRVEEPEDYYVVDRYSYPSYDYDYGYYPYSTPYYPYNSFYPYDSYYPGGKHHGNWNGSFGPGHGGSGGHIRPPMQRPQKTSTTVRSASPARAGTRKR